MEITVTGRHVQVTDRFRLQLQEKLAKVEQYAPRTQRVDVVVRHERSRNSRGRQFVEITCLAKGPVIRAEAAADDTYAALDLALEKLTERLRRAGERKRVQRRKGSPNVQGGMAEMALPDVLLTVDEPTPTPTAEDRIDAEGDSPVHVREKVHVSPPMTLDQAVSAMELVGHDFFLYFDKDTNRPSVVYKRRGWEYGVLHLEVVEDDAAG
ncbi:MAG: ribosome-associated translation inhibitor RaiA [Austwickia sp.]|nr:ribosome-associated translation inhibitor RaiA [Austwickia sp.]MBK9101578.1 ribosome-associated translation inhibitor RaiA [Austwickia sp.]